jgi:hypothetical protein
MSGNTLGFLLSTIQLFEDADLPAWVFGGWAEEVLHLAPKRMHQDIDFLYPAATFEHLDRFIAQAKDFQEIQAKRFSHKRAILYRHVMIEFLLVQGNDGVFFTDFFWGRFRLEWPADVFCHKINISGHDFQVASARALSIYRQHHQQIELAYQNLPSASR